MRKNKVQIIEEKINKLEDELVKAKENQTYRCVTCGKRFKAWSYNGGIDSTDERIVKDFCSWKCKPKYMM